MNESNYWSILVHPASPARDGPGRALCKSAHLLGLTHLGKVSTFTLFFIKGKLDDAGPRLIAEQLLSDPVTESFDVFDDLTQRPPGAGSDGSIEVHYLPGVMDPVAMTTLAALQRLLLSEGMDGCYIDEVRTARRYELSGLRGIEELELIARRILHNPCNQRAFLWGMGRNDALPTKFPQPPVKAFDVRTIELRSLDDNQLTRLSRDGHLFLSLDEMRAIQSHYDNLGKDPTDLELETLAQTWSEHCVHKTFNSSIEYSGEDFGREGAIKHRFDNLFKETIVDATRRADRDWCLSVFHDNAGIIGFDDEYGIAFKAETHNHPSAIEPYGGAATGLGGCIRDMMGCGLGAKPIASTDVFCLAPPTFDQAKLPKGVLHPRRVLAGVVGGVRDYGNRMGIPTVNGAIYFHDRYLANPLVFCGCVGLIPLDRIEKSPAPGDMIVLAGGRTGRDGIHGATFSSAQMEDTASDEFSHAVQIGNAIEEKKLLDALLQARDHPGGCLYSAVTDCGAGGLSSAVGEMGEELGATVDLEKVPLKYAGLSYEEIWISEAQERMVFAVPPGNVETMLKIFAGEESEAVVIGQFCDDRVLRVRYRGQTVGELDMGFLHNGLPMTTRTAKWNPPPVSTVAESNPSSPEVRLLAELSSLNVASKEWVIRQYDHEVQGRSVIKPLTGPGAGPSDAAVIRPRLDSHRAIAIGCGLCPETSEVDPYWMAVAAVDEALRNVICTGGDPERTAILDNFCWPKCDSEQSLGSLVRACRGAADAAVAYRLPFISGKDSLNNEFSMSPAEAKRLDMPEQIAILPTLLISAVSVIADARRCVSMDLKKPGHAIVLASAPVEKVGLECAMRLHTRVAKLIEEGRVRSAHDVSDGGLLVALAEMCIASGLGLDVKLDDAPAGFPLYEQIQTTYLLEMATGDARALGDGMPIIATVRQEPIFSLHVGSKEILRLEVSRLAEAWRRPLENGGGA